MITLPYCIEPDTPGARQYVVVGMRLAILVAQTVVLSVVVRVCLVFSDAHVSRAADSGSDIAAAGNTGRDAAQSILRSR